MGVRGPVEEVEGVGDAVGVAVGGAGGRRGGLLEQVEERRVVEPGFGVEDDGVDLGVAFAAADAQLGGLAGAGARQRGALLPAEGAVGGDRFVDRRVGVERRGTEEAVGAGAEAAGAVVRRVGAGFGEEEDVEGDGFVGVVAQVGA